MLKLRDAKVHDYPNYKTDTGRLLRGHLTGDWFPVIDRGGATGLPLMSEDDMLLRQSLMTVNRYESQPAIHRDLANFHIVLDRYWLSSLCYGKAEGLDEQWIRDVSSSLLQPDLWILIDVPAETGARRRVARDKNERDIEKLRKVRQNYIDEFNKQLAAEWVMDDSMPGSSNFAIMIDGTQSAEKVTRDIWSFVARKFGMDPTR